MNMMISYQELVRTFPNAGDYSHSIIYSTRNQLTENKFMKL